MSRARISAIDRLSRQSTYVSALESRPSWQTTGASLLSDGERHSIALDSQATGSRSSSRASGLERGGAGPPPQLFDPSVHRTSWPLAAMTVCAEVMGAGVLSLAHATATLGWVLGLACAVGFGAVSLYSGLLLARVACDLAPGAESFADAAAATVGPRFAAFTRGAILLTWALQLPYFLTGCAHALGDVAFAGTADAPSPLCYWQWVGAASLALVLPLQLRSLHALSYAAAASTLAIVVALVLVAVALLAAAAPPTPHAADASGGGGDALWPQWGGGGGGGGGGAAEAADGALRIGSAAASFIFAYQGQSVYLEIIREMRDRSHFRRTLYLATAAMVLVYVAVVAVGYATLGRAAPAFLPAAMPPGPLRTAAGLLLAFHTAVSYLVTAQPLHRAYHRLLAPSTADAPSAAAAARWLALSAAQLAAGFVVATALPFFAPFQSLLGALTGAPILFGYPALFYLRGAARRGVRVALGDRGACAVFLAVCLPLFTVLGTADAVREIASGWGEDPAGPFACAANRTASFGGLSDGA